MDRLISVMAHVVELHLGNHCVLLPHSEFFMASINSSAVLSVREPPAFHVRSSQSNSSQRLSS